MHNETQSMRIDLTIIFIIKMNSILNKLSLKDEEEIYIPETESFIVLKNYILETMPKTTQKFSSSLKMLSSMRANSSISGWFSPILKKSGEV